MMLVKNLVLDPDPNTRRRALDEISKRSQVILPPPAAKLSRPGSSSPAPPPAGSFMAMTPSHEDALSAWRRLNDAVGLTGANAGEHRTLVSGPEPLSGVVEHVHQDARQRYILLRLDAPSTGLAMLGTYDKGATSHAAAGPTTNVTACLYYYGADATARATTGESLWRAWLDARFAAEPPAS